MSLVCFIQVEADIRKAHNSLEEIQKHEGKLKLELIREWSREDEMDEYKIFYEPKDVAVNDEGNIHIKGVIENLMSDDENIPVKVWLVPSNAVNCGLYKMTAWTPNLFLFEE